MYSPRYLSQFDQAKLLARLEALESEVAALHRAPRARNEPTRDEVARAERNVREEIERIQAEDKKRAVEAAKRDYMDTVARTPFEEHWERRYGPQPTLMNRRVVMRDDAAAVRFAPGTPSEHVRHMRLDPGAFLRDATSAPDIFGQAMRNRGMSDELRSMVTTTVPPADRETSGREILDSIERAKKTIADQRTDDHLSSLSYLSRSMFETLAADAPSQELRRPARGEKLAGRRPLPPNDALLTSRAEDEAIRQGIMDNAAKAKEQK